MTTFLLTLKKQLIMRKANNIDKDLRQLMHDRLPDARPHMPRSATR